MKPVTDPNSILFDEGLYVKTCSSKKKYTSPNHAQFEIDILESRNSKLKLKYYKCPYCGNYHLSEVL